MSSARAQLGIVAALAFVVGASGCGSSGHGATVDAAVDAVDAASSPCGPVTGSCASSTSIVVLCSDYTGSDTGKAAPACMATEGTWATTPCDRGGTVRGCLTIGASGCTTDWYGDTFEADERCVGADQQIVIP
jgi:hypothetical protein